MGVSSAHLWEKSNPGRESRECRTLREGTCFACLTCNGSWESGSREGLRVWGGGVALWPTIRVMESVC